MLIPTALAFFASANTLWNGYATDDTTQVLGSTFIKQLSNLPRAFTTSVWAFAATDIAFTVDSYYRPLFNALFTLNYALFGESAWGFHLVNVLIHTAVTLLVFVIFSEVTGRHRLALLAAALFAVHPAHSESIAWISGITDPLMSLFLLPAFYFYVRYRKTNKRILIALALVAYLAALLSKETALALPPLVIYYELFYLGPAKPFKHRLAWALAAAAVFALPTAVYFALRYNVLAGALFGSEARYPLGGALATIPLAIVKYLRLMLVPTGYSYQHYTALVGRVISLDFVAPLAIIAALVTCIVLAKSRVLAFATVWFIVTLAPALAALRHFEPEYLVQERYLYLPSMGICLVLALGAKRLAGALRSAKHGQALAAGPCVLVLVVWGAVYVRLNGVWNDSLTVYKNCVAVAPQSPLAHNGVARTYFDLGRPREAEAEARTALDLDSQCISAYVNLSYFAHSSGKLDKSIEFLETATREINENAANRHMLATADLNLGVLYLERREPQKAEETLLHSIAIWQRPVGWYHLGEFYLGQSRFEEARAMFEKTVTAVPSWFAPVHRKLGLAYEGLKDTPNAIAEYQKYVELAPPGAQDITEVQRRIAQLHGGNSR